MLLAACGGDPNLLGKMCHTLTARVPEHLAALRDALRDLDAPRLREAAHKCCGMLSEFSTVAGDLAGSLEDLAARGLLQEALLPKEDVGHLGGGRGVQVGPYQAGGVDDPGVHLGDRHHVLQDAVEIEQGEAGHRYESEKREEDAQRDLVAQRQAALDLPGPHRNLQEGGAARRGDVSFLPGG